MTRQDFYEHLCGLGLHELIAASMAAQASEGAKDVRFDSRKKAVYAFQYWNKTKEGDSFWSWFVDFL